MSTTVTTTSDANYFNTNTLVPTSYTENTVSATIGNEIAPISLPDPVNVVTVSMSLYVSQLTYTADPPLPDSLSISYGKISGTPTTTATSTHTISITDSYSKVSTSVANYTFHVTSPSSSFALNTGSLAAVIIAAVLGLIILLLIMIVLRQRRLNRRPFDFRKIVHSNDLEVSGDRNIPREIKRVDVRVEAVLGKGNFGEVSKGVVNEPSNPIDLPVAIKVLHPSPDAANARLQLLEEAALMAQFDHGNVVRLIGVVTVGHPLMVLMEFCANGTLDSHLEKNETTHQAKLSIAIDCAKGLEYLASRKFIHRDIAARNILLDESMACKIADFGMSREARENKDYYTSKGGQIPIRWTAPECLEEHKFSEKSDVWSYAVLLYEVWTKAATPYSGWRNEKVWVYVLGGYRLPCPPGCPVNVHSLMMECRKDAADRPTFTDIIHKLQTISNSPIGATGGANTAPLNQTPSSPSGLVYTVPDISGVTHLVPDVPPPPNQSSTDIKVTYTIPDVPAATQPAVKRDEYFEPSDGQAHNSYLTVVKTK